MWTVLLFLAVVRDTISSARVYVASSVVSGLQSVVIILDRGSANIASAGLNDPPEILKWEFLAIFVRWMTEDVEGNLSFKKVAPFFQGIQLPITINAT